MEADRWVSLSFNPAYSAKRDFVGLTSGVPREIAIGNARVPERAFFRHPLPFDIPCPVGFSVHSSMQWLIGLRFGVRATLVVRSSRLHL